MNNTASPSVADLVDTAIKARDALNELIDGLNSFVAENDPLLNNKINGQLRAVLKSCQATRALILHHIPDAHTYLKIELPKLKAKETTTNAGASTPPASDQP